jgi:stress response protein YsnF
MVVEKQLLLKEELHIRKRREMDSVEVPVTLKRQWADIDRSEGSDRSGDVVPTGAGDIVSKRP